LRKKEKEERGKKKEISRGPGFNRGKREGYKLYNKSATNIRRCRRKKGEKREKRGKGRLIKKEGGSPALFLHSFRLIRKKEIRGKAPLYADQIGKRKKGESNWPLAPIHLFLMPTLTANGY